PLKNWFSFTYNKNIITQKPNADYYVDFKYTDSYNYMFEFNKPIEISNIDAFSKNINNTYFDLSSKLVKQSDASYLLSVIIKVKKDVVPENDGQKLVELANNLEELNGMVLKLK
ncbi:MAG TPA: hypothetical protein PK289_08370, partial [Bacteroidia bacterium]|nr:hypothetical protein [Bacteroidia bacterium]